jgi:hypothetical protein
MTARQTTPRETIEAVARGERVSSQAFLEALTDGTARRELARALQLRAVVQPLEDPAIQIPEGELDISLEEVTRYLEHGSLADRREESRARRFLETWFPAGDAVSKDDDTQTAVNQSDAETVIDPKHKPGPQSGGPSK